MDPTFLRVDFRGNCFKQKLCIFIWATILLLYIFLYIEKYKSFRGFIVKIGKIAKQIAG